MRSASVSEAAVPDAASRGGIGAPLLILPLVAGASVLTKALLLEQPLSLRTLLLAAVAGTGALLAALPIAGCLAVLARRWRPMLRASIAALFMAGAFIPATMFAFAIENRLIEGHIEAESVTALSARELFWTLFGGMGLFTPTGLPYLLPWPLLAVTATAFVCFYHWPKPPAGAPR
jgi:hypothetical protein